MTFNPFKIFEKFTNWFAEKLTPKAKILIAVAVLMVMVGLGFAGYKINHYFEHDPQACFVCHVHDEANKQWAKSEHASINCHECHRASKKDQVKQTIRFVFFGQRTVAPRHGEIIVSRTLCLGCHWASNPDFPKAPDISGSRYHAKHVFMEKIECTKCHGYRTHKFTMEERYCITCHRDKEFKPHGTTDKPQAKVPMGDLPCLNCHTDRTANLLPGRKKCLFCHGDETIRKELTADGTIDVKHFQPSPATISRAKKISIPANAAMNFDCNTCHNPHERARPDWANCTIKCHQNVLNIGKHSSHVQGVGMHCKQCHKPHTWKVTTQQAKKDCVVCHEYKEPKKFISG